MMIRSINRHVLARLLVSALLAMQVVACKLDDVGINGGGSNGNGDGDKSSSSNGVATVQRAGNTLQVLSGSVGDGPITGAIITIYNAAGEVLATTVSDSNAVYHSSVLAGPEDYPLILEVTGGIDLVTGAEPDFRMESVVMSESDQRVNVNPFTTIIVKSAASMSGGINQLNVDFAKAFVARELGFGLDADEVPDPVTTSITDSNIADIVKASEAMGEMIRRVRDASAAAGEPMSGDEVVDVLSADITDGFLDGFGAVGAHPKVARLARLVSAQVLIENMANQLKVGGVIATNAMDNAIRVSHPSVAMSALTDSVAVTPRLLEQAKALVEDARSDGATPVIDQLAEVVATIRKDMSADEIALALPVNAGADLDSAVAQAAVDLVFSERPVSPIEIRKLAIPSYVSTP